MSLDLASNGQKQIQIKLTLNRGKIQKKYKKKIIYNCNKINRYTSRIALSCSVEFGAVHDTNMTICYICRLHIIIKDKEI